MDATNQCKPERAVNARLLTAVLLLVGITGCAARWTEPLSPESFMKCNGEPHLCLRRYNEVAYATTHNSMSSAEDGWVAPNQLYNIQTQLNDGVRGFMLDLHYYEDEPWLCHSYCSMGRKRFADSLVEFREFMDENPNEVLSFILENYVSAEDIRAAFYESGLMPYLHVQEPGGEWPTLLSMIRSGRRLVVFTDSGGGVYEWLHRAWTYCWETHWSNRFAEDMTCDRNRGAEGNDLFILNHFLTRPFARPELAEEVNHNPFFMDRALECMEQSGRPPNFVTVDFYSIGDLLDVVRALNAR